MKPGPLLVGLLLLLLGLLGGGLWVWRELLEAPARPTGVSVPSSARPDASEVVPPPFPAVPVSREEELRIDREWTDGYLALDPLYRQKMSLRRYREAANVVYAFLYVSSRERLRSVPGVDYESLQKAVLEWNPGEIVRRTTPAVDHVLTHPPTPSVLAVLDLRHAAGLAMKLSDGGIGWETMTDEEVTETFFSKGEERDGGDREFWTGLFLHYSSAPGSAERAIRHWVRSEEQGGKLAPWLRRRCAEASRIPGSEEERSRYEEVERLRKEERWREMLDLLGAEAGDPKWYDAAGEARRRLLALEPVANRLQGRVEGRPDRWIVTYDFSSSESMTDFTPAGTGQTSWGVEGGGLVKGSPRSEGLQWRPRIRGDVRIEYDLTVLEERNIVTTLYYHPESARHYSFTLGLDLLAGRKDEGNRREREMGLPRHAILKHPVPTEGLRPGEERYAEVWRSRLIGRTEHERSLTVGETYRISVERHGARLRMSVGETCVAAGEDSEYEEGFLLFFSDSRLRIDNLRITCIPAE